MSLTRLRHYFIGPCIVLFISSPFLHSFASPLSFKITDFSHNDASKITYEGDAAVSDRAIKFYLDDSDPSNGTIVYAESMHLWDCSTRSQANFGTNFSFTIDSVDASASLSFFLAPVHPAYPPNLTARGEIVVVEFEINPNSNVGININGETYCSESYARRDANLTGNVLITYNAKTKTLNASYIKERSYLSCSNIIDLKAALPKWVTIGFFAAGSSKHKWHSWEFHSNFESMALCYNKKRTIVVVSVVVCFLILMLVVGVISWLLAGVKRKRYKNDSRGGDIDSVSSISTDLERGALPKKFSYSDLVAATEGFADDRRLGQGGSGQVYRGTLGDLDRPVAVKRIFTESQHSQCLFINEVKIISRLIHRNLVQFIGWCHERGEFLLVYEHMSNGSLDNHLFGDGEILPWNSRYKIALGLASALHYLHEEAENCVLHRDIKSANILLDADFSTKLGDFGVAKLVDPRLRTQSTGVVGTYGYLAPEYANEGKASKASDVFSFGVVALEIACGRRTYQDGEFHVSLVRWIWQLYLAGDILNAADERLRMSFNRDEMKRLLIVGLWCTNPNYKERPKTGQVMKVLLLESPLPELSDDMHDSLLQPIPPPQEGHSFQPSMTSSLNYGGR
nr:L-type lectin-domain containing receptor kinase IX.1-like [Quercus suber]POF01580.1 l-type lectin-domain containing receptor kinase ix.1 [Quercus suber]